MLAGERKVVLSETLDQRECVRVITLPHCATSFAAMAKSCRSMAACQHKRLRGFASCIIDRGILCEYN